MKQIHQGSCLCGKVSYEIQGDFEYFYLCHCKYCRKDTGSAHAANLFSSTAELIWLSGQKEVRTFDFASSGHIKSFCIHCGLALPNMQMDGELLVVPVGSLNSELSLKPQGHIFVSHKAKWDNDLHSIVEFDGYLKNKKMYIC